MQRNSYCLVTFETQSKLCLFSLPDDLSGRLKLRVLTLTLEVLKGWEICEEQPLLSLQKFF